MKRLLVISTVLFSLAASAQAFVFRLPSDNTTTEYTFGAAECTNTLTMSWRYVLPVSGTPTDGLEIWTTRSSSCGTEPGTDDVVLTTVPYLQVVSLQQGSFSVDIANLPSFAGDGGTTCPSPTPMSVTSRVCGAMPYVIGTIGGSNQYARATAFPLTYDTLPPNPPLILRAVAQDSAVSVEFSVTDAVTVKVEVKGPSDADYREVGEAVVANTSTVRGTGLVNNEAYEVRLRAVDAAGNVSDPSGAITVTPIDTIGFYGYFARNGGELQGGCATAPGLMTLLLAALSLRLRRMKR